MTAMQAIYCIPLCLFDDLGTGRLAVEGLFRVNVCEDRLKVLRR